ncbi:MAG: hypothetical protein CVV44_21700 [Spirochaetae bacterium HGW-Spirochaetae-1]|jgi:ABC-type molybdate transport system substrate-binding protein|nr:MAG: hypothetical protein CVV44_21700 [Spirochaetae bacterium HGW-Spirochaetae-1]
MLFLAYVIISMKAKQEDMNKPFRMWQFLLAIAVLTDHPASPAQEKISIPSATNFIRPFKELAAQFGKNTDITLVTAQDIARSFQYASSEFVDASFCALSAVYSEVDSKGCYHHICHT